MAAMKRDSPHTAMTDHKWMDIVETLQQAATDCYANGPRKEQMEGYKELAQQRETILKQRRRVRNHSTELRNIAKPVLRNAELLNEKRANLLGS